MEVASDDNDNILNLVIGAISLNIKRSLCWFTENWIHIDPHALPKKDNKATDSSVTPHNSQLQSSKWTRDGLLEHIIKLVTQGNLPFTMIEKEAFYAVLKFQLERPQTKDSVVPDCTTLCEAILSKTLKVKGKLWVMFKEIPGQMSITFNAWTLKAFDPYLAITQIVWNELLISVEPDQYCKVKVSEDKDLEDVDIEDWLNEWGPTLGDDYLVEDEDYDAGDLFEKVRASPQVKSYFVKVCKEENIAPLELVKWVRT
ncbi:hypothetical protein SERLADRAFT_409651 [Serpula lacrymans var. lacrymans S7.9]|uniref:Uncharacterized protein n=1 Tax=Serpula lacrymans var. lacrymans (strain S7.9) TaxID=578457 RepID=F8P296_SERL9|nr:uncharacterized protein SERLADRAFT_409651 [Serpula lacrymans var. lacrymans S7.9]EGO23274.1 hypothetical protein SERLADRAFT_409651 [Serpula lacrymans var. lacrymans S7.9]